VGGGGWAKAQATLQSKAFCVYYVTCRQNAAHFSSKREKEIKMKWRYFAATQMEGEGNVLWGAPLLVIRD